MSNAEIMAQLKVAATIIQNIYQALAEENNKSVPVEQGYSQR